MTENEYRQKAAEMRYRVIRKECIAREKALKKKNRMSQSKLGMWYIFLSCTAVQIYSMIAMWHFADLTPLATLIGATVGEGLAYYAYTAKAKAENTKGGIVYENSVKEEPQG